MRKMLVPIIAFAIGMLFGASVQGRTMLYKATKGKLGSAV